MRQDNPARGLRFLRCAPKVIEPLSSEECQRLVRWAEKTTRERFGTHRSAIMALFLLDCGLRVSECLGLQVSDLDMESDSAGGKVIVRASKTNSWRNAIVSLPLRRLLRRYMARRKAHLAGRGLPDEGWLFCGEHGRRLSVNEAENTLRHIGQRTGIDRLHPHLLRHTWACHSLQNGASMPVVMKAGGWKRLATVQRYCQVSDRMVAEAMQQASPLVGLAGR